MPTPRERPDRATGESAAPPPGLTFSPRRSYRRRGGRWLIEADDALDGDEHQPPDADV
jgi:hypothetical protein